RSGPGNFHLFEEIVTGESPYADGSHAEPLVVPVFTCLGNHDYRSDAYPLVGTLSINVPVELLGDLPWVGSFVEGVLEFAGNIPGLDALLGSPSRLVTVTKEAEEYTVFNLTREEVSEIFRETFLGQRFSDIYGVEVAAKFIAQDPGMLRHTNYYFQRINRDPSFIVQLGANRIVLLDTGPDYGVPKSATQGALAYVGALNDGKNEFTQGRPRTRGVSDE